MQLIHGVLLLVENLLALFGHKVVFVAPERASQRILDVVNGILQMFPIAVVGGKGAQGDQLGQHLLFLTAQAL